MNHRARNQREARRLAAAVASRVLESASDCWDKFTQFENDAEWARFESAWHRLVAELDRRGQDPGGGPTV